MSVPVQNKVVAGAVDVIKRFSAFWAQVKCLLSGLECPYHRSNFFSKQVSIFPELDKVSIQRCPY